MANTLAYTGPSISLDDIEPDPHTATGRAKSVRSMYQCLTYLLQEVRQIGDVKLSEAMEDAMIAAENLMQHLPDYRN